MKQIEQVPNVSQCKRNVFVNCYHLLNGITVNGIIWLKGSILPRLNKSQMSLNNMLCKRNVFGYCYHLVNGISYGQAKSYSNKRRPLFCTKVSKTISCLICQFVCLSVCLSVYTKQTFFLLSS
jgi:hypothetical protein